MYRSLVLAPFLLAACMGNDSGTYDAAPCSGAAGAGNYCGTDASGGQSGGGGGGQSGGGGGGQSGGGGGAPPACGSSNCPGCCYNGSCQPGNTDVACGQSGAECVACVAWEICDRNACTLDLASRWTLTAERGSFPTKKGNGSGWDVGGGAPDGYVQASYHDPVTHQLEAVESTSVVDDEFFPAWAESVGTWPASQLTGQTFQIAVWDQDVDADDFGAAWGAFLPASFAVNPACFDLESSATTDNPGLGLRLCLSHAP